MNGEKPGKETRASAPDAHPGPRRKGRAGLIIVAILVVVILGLFLARNFEHAEELEQNPQPIDGQQVN